MPFSAELTMDFESQAGFTRVTAVWRGEFRGLLKIVEWLLQRSLKKAMDKDIAALKTVLEEG